MPPISLALIGCGQLGKTHARAVARIPQARFVAYADVVAAAAEGFLREFGGLYATTDPKRIFQDPDVRAVYICTRHDSHACLQDALLSPHSKDP